MPPGQGPAHAPPQPLARYPPSREMRSRLTWLRAEVGGVLPDNSPAHCPPKPSNGPNPLARDVRLFGLGASGRCVAQPTPDEVEVVSHVAPLPGAPECARKITERPTTAACCRARAQHTARPSHNMRDTTLLRGMAGIVWLERRSKQRTAHWALVHCSPLPPPHCRPLAGTAAQSVGRHLRPCAAGPGNQHTARPQPNMVPTLSREMARMFWPGR